MSKSAPFQGDFSLGELSPRLAGRAALGDHAFSLERCFNAVITPHGNFERRPGTLYLGKPRAGGVARLIPWEIAGQGLFLLELTHQRLRVWSNRKVLKQPGSNAIFEMALPYRSADFRFIDYVAGPEALFLVHPHHAPRRLTFSGGWFSGAPIAFKVAPLGDLNPNPNARLSFHASRRELVWNTASPALTPDMAGRNLVFFAEGRWWTERITLLTGSRRAKVEGSSGLWGRLSRATPATHLWRFSRFGPGAYPRHVGFHENRLVFANLPGKTTHFWMSKAGDPLDFSLSDYQGNPAPDYAIQGYLSDRDAGAIQWLFSRDKRLMLGTTSGLWAIGSNSGLEALTPLSARAYRQNAGAVSFVRPLMAGTRALYLHRAGTRLLAMPEEEESRNPPDAFGLSASGEHLSAECIDELAWQEEPYGLLWCRTASGRLLAATLNNDGLPAWHQHEIAGRGSDHSHAVVESLAALPSPLMAVERGGESELYMLVRRTVGGKTLRSIEVLAPYWRQQKSHTEGRFLDAARVQSSATAKREFTGWGHLEGERLDALADGRVVSGLVVSGGGINLPFAARTLVAGLPYDSEGALQDWTGGSMQGPSVARPRHLYEVFFKLWRSPGLEAGSRFSALEQLAFKDTPGPEEEGDLPLFSGDLRFHCGRGGWDRKTRLVWRQSRPLPLVLLALSLRLETSD